MRTRLTAFVRSYWRCAVVAYALMLILWSAYFFNEPITSNLLYATKIFLFLWLPGTALVAALFKSKPVQAALVGLGAGVVADTLLYYLFGLLNIGLGITVYLAPVIVLAVSVVIVAGRKTQPTHPEGDGTSPHQSQHQPSADIIAPRP